MKRVIALICLVFLSVGVSLADEGRIPIYEPIVLDGNLGAISGSYVVTRNITATSGPISSPIIDIVGTGTETVEIDLNGFTLSGDLALSGKIIACSNVKRFTLRNGSIVQPSSGEEAIHVEAIQGEDDEEALIEDVRIVGTGTDITGINLFEVSNFNIRRNHFVNADLTVVSVPPGAVQTGMIEDNIVRESSANVSGGTSGSSHNILIRDNVFVAAAVEQLLVSASSNVTVEDNRLSGGIRIIIQQSMNCQILKNTVSGAATGIGLMDTDDCVVANNSSSGNTFDGINLNNSDRNRLESNSTNDNGVHGIHIQGTSTDNTYGRNSARGNGPGGCGNAGIPTCGAPDICDDGVNSTSFGDNLIPGPPPC